MHPTASNIVAIAIISAFAASADATDCSNVTVRHCLRCRDSVQILPLSEAVFETVMGLGSFDWSNHCEGWACASWRRLKLSRFGGARASCRFAWQRSSTLVVDGAGTAQRLSARCTGVGLEMQLAQPTALDRALIGWTMVVTATRMWTAPHYQIARISWVRTADGADQTEPGTKARRRDQQTAPSAPARIGSGSTRTVPPSRGRNRSTWLGPTRRRLWASLWLAGRTRSRI